VRLFFAAQGAETAPPKVFKRSEPAREPAVEPLTPAA
jgi:hypothetical protein